MRVRIGGVRGEWIDTTRVDIEMDREDLAATAGKKLKPSDHGIDIQITQGYINASVRDEIDQDPCEIAGGEILTWLS